MSKETKPDVGPSRPEFLLWAGVFAGPVAWFLQQQLNYAVATWVCSFAGQLTLHLGSLAFLLLALGGGLISWRYWQQAGGQWPDEAGGVVSRHRFLSALGILMSSLFSLIVIAQWLPTLFYHPCQRGV